MAPARCADAMTPRRAIVVPRPHASLPNPTAAGAENSLPLRHAMLEKRRFRDAVTALHPVGASFHCACLRWLWKRWHRRVAPMP